MITNRDKISDTLGTHGREIVILDGITEDPEGYVTVQLPSKKNKIRVRGMTGEEENLFGQDNAENPYLPVESCVRRCVKGGDVLDSKSFLLDDYIFSIYMIRRMTYGDIFSFTAKCPNCKVELQCKFDLSQAEIFTASKESEAGFRTTNGTFITTLPRSGYKLKYITPMLEHQNINIQIAKKDPDRLITEAVRNCIVEVIEGNDKEFFKSSIAFAKLHNMDIAHLENEISKHQVGVNSSVNFNCFNCTFKGYTELPLRRPDFLAVAGELTLRPDGRYSTLWAAPPAKN